MVRTGNLSPNKNRNSPSADTPPTLPSMPSLAPTILTTLAVLENIVLTPALPTNGGGVSAEGELQLPYQGQITSSPSAVPGTSSSSLPQIQVTESDFNASDSVIDDLFGKLERNVLDANVLASDTPVNIETEANVTNTERNEVATDDEDSISLPRSLFPSQATLFNDYNSDDDFDAESVKRYSSLSFSLKGKSKAKASQRGIGSFGKGALLKRKSVEPVATPSISAPKKKLKVKSSNTENDGSILRKMLSGPATLPAKRTSGPQKNVGCVKKQVKGRNVTSVKPAGNIVVRPGCSGAVLPPPVASRPVVHVIESDEEPELFSQTTENVVSGYLLVRDRIRREHSEDLANVQSSEDDLRRAEEVFRRAEEARQLAEEARQFATAASQLADEARRVAFEKLERHRRALDKSSRKLRRMDGR